MDKCLTTYIKETPDSDVLENDKSRYQTVFANTEGAVAAPTAGLHLTNELLDEIEKIKSWYVK